MVVFKAAIFKYAENGEKTGWTCICIPALTAQKIMPGMKRSFRVKGKLDNHPVRQLALIPVGGGDFILPLNADLRKVLGKRKGDFLMVQLEHDAQLPEVTPLLMECLADEPVAFDYFHTLAKAHQLYFSKWILSAKTETTQVARIARAVNALRLKMGYPEMIRAGKDS